MALCFGLAAGAIAGAIAGALGFHVASKFKKKPPNSKWTKKEKLGEGGFGAVYRAVDTTGNEIAMKIVDMYSDVAPALESEIKILKDLNHRNIVKYFGYEICGNELYMLLELMEGSVRDKINKLKGPLAESVARRYTIDMVTGLRYLHLNNIIHRDIKCANVLLDSKDTAKLADMGLSKPIDDQSTVRKCYGQRGTYFWMSPEVFSGQVGGRRSDVWSVGCAVYEMVKFNPPFHTKDLYQIFEPKLEKMKHRELVKQDREIGKDLKNFLKKIFVLMEKRPYAYDIAQHPWLQEKSKKKKKMKLKHFC